jgi:hypothetical protein
MRPQAQGLGDAAASGPACALTATTGGFGVGARKHKAWVSPLTRIFFARDAQPALSGRD